MKLTRVYGVECASKSCPTVYVADNGNYVLQGYVVDQSAKDNVPNGEDLVELPKDFVEGFIKQYMAGSNE